MNAFLLFSCILQCIAAAQGPGTQTFGGAPYLNRCSRVEELYRELLLSSSPQSAAEARIQIAKRREAQYKERQFLLKAERLVESWSALVREYNKKGTFNVKTAREVSKAFHDLEKAEGWPNTDHR